MLVLILKLNIKNYQRFDDDIIFDCKKDNVAIFKSLINFLMLVYLDIHETMIFQKIIFILLRLSFSKILKLFLF
jgi:hypothetical protein